MAKLPESWGLTVSTNAQGKAEITGTADDGSRYRVRTCDGPEPTQKDLQELHAADREAYPNRDTRARDFVRKLVGDHPEDAPLVDQALSFDDAEWIEAAMPCVEAGFGISGSHLGYSRAYARNFDYAFQTLEEVKELIRS